MYVAKMEFTVGGGVGEKTRKGGVEEGGVWILSETTHFIKEKPHIV